MSNPDQSGKRTPCPYSADNPISVFVRRGKYGHRYPGDANQSVRFVGDSHIPDLAFAANMQWLGYSKHPSVTYRADVIGIDFLTYAVALAWIHNMGRSPGSQGFGQNHRNASMQGAGRLSRATVNRHPPFEIIRAGFKYFYAKMAIATLLPPLIDVIDGKG